MALKFYAAEWRKIRRKRFKPTGMGKLLDTLDTQYKEYIQHGREKFIEMVSGTESAESDDKRFLRGFKDGTSAIKKIYVAHSRDWTDKERRFIDNMLKDYAEEVKFWEKKPCTKLYRFEKNLAIKIVGEREKVLKAVQDLESYAKDSRKRLKVIVTIESK
ncbi:MAG: hypothetical protein GTO42_08635 [Candidatus Latescibacteria bacterium]|nr:hypothetical protein [Candidatus Latescibacterota bacterium]NIO29026.1 hypothetical protein [Candidatus Latescibacterota bacterium]NIO56651.1 hypothetical protein [Candidatus Latescibacterota bacterium]NIT02234.1 hypothetical protein [Candidatus Latescibacterota bacterium]NIT39119.1 hypothetical protein [Candidatus Latescibacterota bacterium]